MSSDLKTQFVNYMSLQRFSHHTKRSYLTGVKLLTKHYMQSPDTLTNDQIQDYIRYLGGRPPQVDRPDQIKAFEKGIFQQS